MTFADKALGYATGLVMIGATIGGIWSLAQIIGAIVAAPVVVAQLVLGFWLLVAIAEALDSKR